MTKESVAFKTEVKQLLDLMIHSIYTHKDIFLRELISNASDAIDKLRFAALTNAELLEERGTKNEEHLYKIKITANKNDKTLTIIDNGIGMLLQEVHDNIGTIAKSGTKAFLEELKKNPDAGKNLELIGQFGVGFYSAFMVADRVTLRSRRAGEAADQGVLWESTGDGQYQIETADQKSPGTQITLHLKDDCLEYLEEYRIREIVKRYSDFVEHPIVMDVTREQAPLDADGKEIKDAKPIATTVEETLNSRKAI